MGDLRSRSNHVIQSPRFRNLLCLLTLLLPMGAVACGSLSISEPGFTAARALNAVRKEKLDSFRKQLTDGAQATLGTDDEMESIRRKLAGYTKVSVSAPLLVSSRQGDQGYGYHGDVRRTYTATIAGSPRKDAPIEAIYELTFKCKLSYEQYHHDSTPESCSTTIDDNGVPWTNCTGGNDAYDSIDLDETCSIARIDETHGSSSE